jgi:hypothetical protein
MFLELYQKNNLINVIPYFTKNSRDVVKRINNAMKVAAQEILSIYHVTRGHKNETIYDSLPTSYKNILYIIHGIYLAKKTKRNSKHVIDNNNDEFNDMKENISVSVHDVYNCMKNMDAFWLRKIFIDRIELINNNSMSQLFDYQNFDALVQGKLMM